MYSLAQVEGLKDALVSNFGSLNHFTPSTEELRKAYEEKDASFISFVIDRVKDAYVAAVPDIDNVPVLVRYVNCTYGADEDAISTVHLTVRNSTRSAFKYSASCVLDADVHLVEKVEEFFRGVYRDLIEYAAQYYNITLLNEELETITKEAEVPYSVQFSLSGNNKGDAIEYISDTELIYRVDRDKLFSADNVLLASNIDDLGLDDDELESAKKVIEKVHKDNVSQFRAIATTPEFVAAKLDFIRTFVHVESFQPRTLIRKSLSRTVAVLNTSKKDERFRIEGEKDGVRYFGIGERVNGELQVPLHPFDVSTCKPVDVDILAGLNA